jgi:HSP20 family protein
MAITRWDPFRELYSLQNQLNRLFQDSYGNNQSGQGQGDEFLSTSSFVPPVDVYEDEHNVFIRAEVPGIDPNDLDIKVENNVLTIRGERKWNKEEKEENFHRVERRYGSFTRSFTLPNTVNTDDVNASYNNGVLELKLGKRAEAKPKQIKVGIGATAQGHKTIEGGQGKKSQAA